MVSRINGIYGSLEFSPVHHYHHHLDQDDYFALLSVADIGLITSVRDGMNTTSHEFVVCQQNNFSPLILSELSGTASKNEREREWSSYDESLTLFHHLEKTRLAILCDSRKSVGL